MSNILSAIVSKQIAWNQTDTWKRIAKILGMNIQIDISHVKKNCAYIIVKEKENTDMKQEDPKTIAMWNING